MISLLDTADKVICDYWVVFRDLPADSKRSRLWRLLKPGFEHVEAWRFDRGLWLRLDPCWELCEATVEEGPPWERILPELRPTCVRVQRAVPRGRLRDPFTFGPSTCVELVKALIGLRAFFVRTPYQLYRALHGPLA